MNYREQYEPGPARAEVQKTEGDKWTLILFRELRHSPEKVWQALIDPEQLREWAPFEVDGRLDAVGSTVNLTWVGAPMAIPTTVTRADAPHALEFGDIRWALQPSGGGTRLTLWSNIDRRYISMGAAGWHISLDILAGLLDGTPIGRIAGPEAMKFGAWQRLNQEYGTLFGVKAPSWPQKAKES